jgi:DNA-directed RNA polymerase subunit RPC12/RpoP
MKIKLCVNKIIELSNPKLETIVAIIQEMMQELLPQLIDGIVLNFADEMLKNGDKGIQCERCGSSGSLRWKTRHGELTKIITIFQSVSIRQLQMECTHCNHRFYITRRLLGIAPRKNITDDTRRKLALIGALASFRVSEKITSLFGWGLDKMMIWRCVQETAEEITFDLDPKEEASGEADGTGIPIQGIKKRGKELKVFVQNKKKGGIRIAGLSIGDYDKDWSVLFSPLIPTLKRFVKPFLLVTDGDTGAFKALHGKVKVLFQRCLWHIPYQMRYYLWKDGVQWKSDVWYACMSRLFDICSHREHIDDEMVIQKLITLKKRRLKKLITHCRTTGLKNCTSYLFNAQNDLFTSLENKLKGHTTSHVERVMRTVNLRINVGKWSLAGSLNATKIRLAYYYNGWDI